MSSSGWTLPVIIIVIIGFGLFGVYSYVDHTYGSPNARNAPQAVVPVLSPGDERVSSVQQPGDTSASTPLPTLAEPPSSGVTRLPIDSWMSEVMETTLRGSLVEETKEPDEDVEGDGLLRDAGGGDLVVDSPTRSRKTLLRTTKIALNPQQSNILTRHRNRRRHQRRRVRRRVLKRLPLHRRTRRSPGATTQGK